MCNKYLINKHRYDDFYKLMVRKKLSDFLLEEERRVINKPKRFRVRQQSTDTFIPTIVTTTSITPANASILSANGEE